MQPQTVTIPAEIRAFLDDLLKQGNVLATDEEMHEALIQELYIRLDKFLFTRMLETLPAEKYNDFVALSADPARRDELQIYLQSNIPNTQDFFLIAFDDFRKEYLEYLQKAEDDSSLR